MNQVMYNIEKPNFNFDSKRNRVCTQTLRASDEFDGIAMSLPSVFAGYKCTHFEKVKFTVRYFSISVFSLPNSF